MNGNNFTKTIKNLILSTFVQKLKDQYPELNKWNNEYLFIDQGVNINSNQQTKDKAKHALFLIRKDKFTKINKNKNSSQKLLKTAIGKIDPESANRDLVIYELVHNAKGEVVYNYKGWPKYKPIPLVNIECKVSFYSDLDIVNRIADKIKNNVKLTAFEKSLFLTEKLFTWMSQDPEMKKTYPSFNNPNFKNKLLLSFFTSITQSDNSFAVISHETPIISDKKTVGFNCFWSYISGKNFNLFKNVCPEITPQLLLKFNQSKQKPALPTSIQLLLDELSSKPRITKKDRENFKLGSDQEGRPMSILQPHVTTIFANNLLNNQEMTVNNKLFKDLYEYKNIKNNSMKQVVSNYLNPYKKANYYDTYKNHFASNLDVIDQIKKVR